MISIHTDRILSGLGKILQSRRFFIAVLVLYSLQAIFFSVAINTGDIYEGQYGVAPDEARHFGNVMYFAKRPVADGPFVNSMSDEDLVLGTVTTFPSNTFYYLMAIPAKVAAHLNFSEAQIYLMLRLLVAFIGLIGLVVFRKLAQEVGASRLVANVATLALASTGMYVWESAAVSYDIPALVLMFMLMFYLVRIIKYGRLLPYVFYIIFLVLFVSLVKYTYMPFAGLFTLIAALIYVKRYGLHIDDATRKWFFKPSNRATIAIAALAIAIIFSVFAATIGRNVVQYHSINPDCTRSVEACNRFEIYWRNHKQAALYQDLVASGEIQPYRYTFFGHVGTWMDTYFISMYTYRGHVKDMKPMSYAMTAVLMAAVAALAYVAFRIRCSKPLLAYEHVFLLAAALLYLLVVYVFNVKTLYDFGTAYAYQGRYVLFSVAILYLYVSMAIEKYIKQRKQVTNEQSSLDPRLLIVGVFAISLVIFNPTVSFFMHVNSPDWFTEVARRVIPASLQY